MKHWSDGKAEQQVPTCPAAAAEEAIQGLKLPSTQCTEDDEQQLQRPCLVLCHAQLLQSRLHTKAESRLRDIRTSELTQRRANSIVRTEACCSKLWSDASHNCCSYARSVDCQLMQFRPMTSQARVHLNQLREDRRQHTLQHGRLDHHIAEEPKQLQRQRALLQTPSATVTPA